MRARLEHLADKTESLANTLEIFRDVVARAHPEIITPTLYAVQQRSICNVLDSIVAAQRVCADATRREAETWQM